MQVSCFCWFFLGKSSAGRDHFDLVRIIMTLNAFIITSKKSSTLLRFQVRFREISSLRRTRRRSLWAVPRNKWHLPCTRVSIHSIKVQSLQTSYSIQWVRCEDLTRSQAWDNRRILSPLKAYQLLHRLILPKHPRNEEEVEEWSFRKDTIVLTPSILTPHLVSTLFQ